MVDSSARTIFPSLRSVSTNYLSWPFNTRLNRGQIIVDGQPVQVLTAAQDRTKEQEGGCQVNGPKVAKFLDR